MRPRLFSSFAFLNVTQFLGALNDNTFRLTIAFLGIGLYGEAQTGLIVFGAGVAFLVPFLLFSLPAGTLADRVSKRNILVAMKGMELAVMAAGMFTFYAHTLWGSYVVLFFMAVQSAIFGPAKYGIIPEIVAREKIAMANGILTGFTVVATILGVLFASLLTDFTHRQFIYVGGFCTGIAVLGFLTSLAIEKTPPAGSTRRIDPIFITQIIRVMRRARTENYLFSAVLGSAYFYLFGSFVQFNSLPYTIQTLGLSDVKSGYLFSIASIGIAGGALLAGKLSGKYVELGISPIAGLFLGILFCFTQLGEGSIPIALILLFILGGFGGMFLVPLDAYIQSASLDNERGENVSASNFLAFVGVLMALVLFYILNTSLHLSAVAAFQVIGIITVLVSLFFSLRLTDTFVRLAARLLYAGKGRKIVQGLEQLNRKIPTLFLCTAPTPEAGLLFMIILQQRYMRLVIERSSKPSLPFRLVCRLAKVALYSGPITAQSKAGKKAKRWLERGYSVSLIPQQAESLTLNDLAKQLTEKRPVDLRHVQLAARGMGRWAPPIRATIS